MLLGTAGLFGAAWLPGAAWLMVAADVITDETRRRKALAKLIGGMFTRYMPGQAADTSHTVGERGKRFCPGKTVYADSGKWFPSPRVTRPCNPSKGEK